MFKSWKNEISVKNQKVSVISFDWFITPPRNSGGAIFSSVCQCLCVCPRSKSPWRIIHFFTISSWRGYIFITVCLCVYLVICLYASEQNSSWTDAPIRTPLSLNGSLPHWIGPYRNSWSWVKGQGHSDLIVPFSS